MPSNPLSRIESQLFRVLLLRRLRLPLPPASRMQGFWEGVRALLPVFVGRQVDESPQTCSCGTSTFQCPSTMHVVWKLWWMASRYLEGHKLLLTRRSCQHYIVTGHPTEEQLTVAKSEHIPNSSDQVTGPSLSCWQAKLLADGPRRRCLSSGIS